MSDRIFDLAGAALSAITHLTPIVTDKGAVILPELVNALKSKVLRIVLFHVSFLSGRENYFSFVG